MDVFEAGWMQDFFADMGGVQWMAHVRGRDEAPEDWAMLNATFGPRWQGTFSAPHPGHGSRYAPRGDGDYRAAPSCAGAVERRTVRERHV